MRYSSGRRRRPVRIFATDLAATTPTANPVTPPRRVLARVAPAPWRGRRVVSVRTVLPTGGYQGSPPPSGSPTKTPILIVRGRGPLRWPAPTIPRPQLGRLPDLPSPGTQRVRPRPPLVAADPWRGFRYRPSVVRVPGRPVGLPGAGVDIVPARPARRWPSPFARATRLGTRSIQSPRPPAVGRVLPARGRPALRLQVDSGASVRPVVPARTIVVARIPAAAARKPAPASLVTVASTAGRSARMRLPRPLVAAGPPRKPRPQPWLLVDSGSGWQSSQRRPLIVRPPAPFRLPTRLVAPAPRYPLASPPRHGPLTRPTLVAARRSLASKPDRIGWGPHYPPVVYSLRQPVPSVNPPVAGGPTLPPDLVAACIAWLRLSPAIVAALGDAQAASKIASDVESRGIAPPYLSFAEPDEEEGYETADGTGLASSLAEGTLMVELVAPQSLGKAGTRQLAELVAARLNDAPLTFADGVLVYLRRTKRQFPTSREAGPQSNVVVWKRILTFEYLIERWAPQF